MLWLLVEGGFEGERTFIAESRVTAGAVIEALDVGEDRGASFGAGRKLATVDEFVFQGAPEGLHNGVVVAVALSAHGGDGVVIGEDRPVGRAGVLDAAVGVMEQSRLRPAPFECHNK